MTLVFVDDERAAGFAPFALTRPACELRAGAELVRRRWETALRATTSGFIGAPHLEHFDEPGGASAITGRLAGGTILVNARCAISLARAPHDADVWTCGGRIAAVRLRGATDAADGSALWGEAERFAGGRTAADVEGRWIDHVWDLVRSLPDLLGRDIPYLAESLTPDSPVGITRLGPHPVYVERGATIEPHVVVDAMAGPVLVRRGAVVHAFTRLVGPCVIGEDVIVHGGKVAGSAIGEYSRVCGEVSTSLFLGHANKAHDGFIGHSVLGRWVNIGASTVGSNLKNNYGEVGMWTPEGVQPTGMQFLGTLLGDHAKTAIGTRLTTGALIGAGANVLGAGLTPKYVPPFAWGGESGDESRWELDPFLATAERVMKRRGLTLTEKARRQLAAAWQMAVDRNE